MKRSMIQISILLACAACGGKLPSMSGIKSNASNTTGDPSQTAEAGNADANRGTNGSPNSPLLGLIELPLKASDQLGSSISNFSGKVLIIGTSTAPEIFYIHLGDGSRFRLDTSTKPLSAALQDPTTPAQGSGSLVLESTGESLWQIAPTSAFLTPNGERQLAIAFDSVPAGASAPRILALSPERAILRHPQSIGIYGRTNGTLLRSNIPLPAALHSADILAGGFFSDAPDRLWLLAADGVHIAPAATGGDWKRHEVKWGNLGSPPLSVTATLQNPDQPRVHGNFFAFSRNSIYYVRSAP